MDARSPGHMEAQMLRTAGYVFAICAIGTLAIAWSQTPPHQKPLPLVETISPESLTAAHGPLSESKFNDMSFVFPN
jgi:hypothetical protein